MARPGVWSESVCGQVWPESEAQETRRLGTYVKATNYLGPSSSLFMPPVYLPLSIFECPYQLRAGEGGTGA